MPHRHANLLPFLLCTSSTGAWQPPDLPQLRHQSGPLLRQPPFAQMLTRSCLCLYVNRLAVPFAFALLCCSVTEPLRRAAAAPSAAGGAGRRAAATRAAPAACPAALRRTCRNSSEHWWSRMQRSSNHSWYAICNDNTCWQEHEETGRTSYEPLASCTGHYVVPDD